MLVIRWPALAVSGPEYHAVGPKGFRRHEEVGLWRHTELLAGSANWNVVLVEDNANLVHQPDLLLIVTVQGLTSRVNIGEQPQNRFGRYACSSGCWGRHCGYSRVCRG